MSGVVTRAQLDLQRYCVSRFMMGLTSAQVGEFVEEALKPEPFKREPTVVVIDG